MTLGAAPNVTVFWEDPPWRGGGPKQRLGLRPIERGGWFSPGEPGWREHKHAVLRTSYAEAVATTVSASAAQEALAEVLPAAEREYPDPIANASLEVPDDLCLLDVPDEQRLVAGCVCSPSYWRLRDKIGKSLWDVHAPVQGMNARIGASVRRFVDRAPAMQPFERRNWFLHGDAARFHLEPEAALPAAVNGWFVRSERQTLCRIAERFVLFTIAVTCVPLCDIAGHHGAVNDLLRSLAAMDEDEVAHFGGPAKHARLAAYLRGLAA